VKIIHKEETKVEEIKVSEEEATSCYLGGVPFSVVGKDLSDQFMNTGIE
jgi:hypothetical protein